MMLAPMRLFNERPLTRIFDDVFGEQAADRWVPALDIDENDDSWVVTAELPGVDPKAVEITLDGRELTIRGEKVAAEKDEKTNRRYAERRFGNFERRFTLPEEVAAEAVKAASRDGILTVTIGKPEVKKPRQIPIEG
ncbi:MAG: Hsp20/alpha crystallin family protein [Planctomycetota bacterium]